VSHATATSAAAAVRRPRPPLRVAIVGCGLVGRRRARIAAEHGQSRLVVVADPDAVGAREASGGIARIAADWTAVVERTDVDAVVVSTPNHVLADVAVAALDSGKHVLMEKPMGRSLDEARRIAAAARASTGILRIGFNHRFHPAIRRAHAVARSGSLGRLVTLRARYGHGGRPGLEEEWRSDPERAGGGELTDQGVHLADLLHWIAGMPVEAFAYTQTAVWRIAPLEDNAYGLLRFEEGAVAQLHVSLTQWKNLFSLEVQGEAGAVIVEGLGGSYGVERLLRIDRAFQGGAPAVHEERFEHEDRSWADEWSAFLTDVDVRTAGGADNGAPSSANGDDGVAAMRIVDALYRSAARGAAVTV